jgi:hypothetical protein
VVSRCLFMDRGRDQPGTREAEKQNGTGYRNKSGEKKGGNKDV